ncbi:centromere protein J isoform X2 [Bacillus rossius redtenbacheri]|uniref:centromere protein J isoform X2 n=1 Tax=Bacillus rossius redtenbacheri TaxID=93214 RepID=UPI002FDCA09F
MVKETFETSFDDTPVIATNKPFSSLLEERLLKFQNDSRGCTESLDHLRTKPKPKFSFLRKGTGLGRYYKDPSQIERSTGKGRCKFRVPQRSLRLKPVVEKHEPREKSAVTDTCFPRTRNDSERDVSQDLPATISERGHTWRNALQQKDSVQSFMGRTAHPEISYEDISDGNNTLKENQELKVFELLEQHAANSSFSSSSSYVMNMMERACRSTPKKGVTSISSRGSLDVHKQYAENYSKYISMHSKSENLAAREEMENGGSSDDALAYRLDDNVAEGKSPHVHFADERESESDASVTSEIDENISNRQDLKDDSPWSNDSYCSTCSEDGEDSRANKLPDATRGSNTLPQVCVDGSDIDYSKYPSISVKTLKGILSPTKKPYNVSEMARSTAVAKHAESKRGKNNLSSVAIQTDDTELIFKSELLMSRLQDLEDEIHTLQKAKLELAKMRKEHEDNVRKFTKEKKSQEQKLIEEEERIKSMLEEEKRRLGKERLVLQKHTKNLKNMPTKEEREQIQALKQQIAELQSDVHKKESRWTAFQVRSRDKTKCLERENAKLKQELNELKEKTQKQLKLYGTSRSRAENPTKIINFINKQLGLLTTMNSNKIVSHDKTNELLRYQDKKPVQGKLFGEKPFFVEKPDACKKSVCGEKQLPYGNFTETTFPNGDIEQKFENGRTRFYYASSRTFQTTESNGTIIYEFPNGQTEYHYTDGSKKVTFFDGSIKLIYTTGQEEWVLPDKTRWTVNSHGEKVVTLPNGDKEIYTDEYSRREYSDGTVRTLFPNGRTETRYPNGRLRVKNEQGDLILDIMDTNEIYIFSTQVQNHRNTIQDNGQHICKF